MIFDLKTFSIKKNNFKYKSIEYGYLNCYFRGFIYKKSKRNGKESIKILLDEYKNGNIDFSNYYGSYNVIIVDKTKKEILFFSDNSGSSCFYYSKDTFLISNSFLELSRDLDIKSPNYNSISQFLSFNCIFSEETIIEEIERTQSYNYYVFKYDENTLKSKRKDQEGKYKLEAYKSINEYMKDLVYAINGINVYAVITGGSDSRMLISHLNELSDNYNLIISGNEKMKDVEIAKKIARLLEKEIIVIDDKIHFDNINKFEDLIKAGDGVYPFFGRFRLFSKGVFLKGEKADLDINGAGGEFYKNSYLNQDFPFYFGKKINLERFYKLKINPTKLKEELFTSKIKISLKEMKKRVLSDITSDINLTEKKHISYFKIGLKVMRYRMITISNSSNAYCDLITPLLESGVLDIAKNKKPWSLELNLFHREETSKANKKLSKVKTDRGLSLSNEIWSIVKDVFINYTFLFKVALERFNIIKLKKENVKKESIKTYNKKFINNAINICKENYILNKEVQINDLSDNLIDKLIAVSLSLEKTKEK